MSQRQTASFRSGHTGPDADNVSTRANPWQILLGQCSNITVCLVSFAMPCDGTGVALVGRAGSGVSGARFYPIRASSPHVCLDLEMSIVGRLQADGIGTHNNAPPLIPDREP